MLDSKRNRGVQFLASTLKAIFAAGGIVAAVILAAIIRGLDSRIRELVEQLKEV